MPVPMFQRQMRFTNHAHCQRLLHDVFRQFHTPATLREGFGLPVGEHLQERAGRVFAEGVGIPSQENLQVGRLFVILQARRDGIFRRHGFLEGFVFRFHALDNARRNRG